MDKKTCRLTVFFEEPFWVGIFELEQKGKLSAAKITFGAEPKDYEIYEFILEHYCSLRYSPAVNAVVKEAKRNPKQMQREIKRQTQSTGVGTKSQQALKLQHEQIKTERKQKSREEREAEAERMFKLRQQKKKEKHSGH